MAIPKVDADKIGHAIDEFDTLLRSSPEWENWEDNRAQSWALVHESKRYPPKKIISMATGEAVSSFSGGPESNTYLAERGFTVTRLREVSLGETLRLILERYGPARRSISFGGHHEIRELFTQLRRFLTNLKFVSEQRHLKVVASYGKGNWAILPWVAFLDDRETHTPQDGIFVVYSFAEDGKGCYLNVGQGVISVAREFGGTAADLLSARAGQIRPHFAGLADYGFDLLGRDNQATSNRSGKLFQSSTVAWKYYEAARMPDDEVLLEDLERVLDVYAEYVASTKGKEARALSDTRQLSLLGTYYDAPTDAAGIQEFIRGHGGWACWWSFSIKDDARERLKFPFFLYTYQGKGKLGSRMRVVDLVTSKGNEGIISPWPKQTYSEWLGATRTGPKQSDICKTWVRIDSVEVFTTPMSVEDFEIAPGLSTPENLINQNSFGYVIALDEMSNFPDNPPELEREVPALVLPGPLPLEWLELRTGVPQASLRSMLDAILGDSPQIILAGPPGTSKTWLARQLALYLARDRPSQVRFVQFHQSYSYESFMEGLRPVAKSGGVGFELKDGVVLDVVEQMRRNDAIDVEGDEYVIVIDEANRANLPRVLGELMFLFEYRGEVAHLQYSGPFSLPENLRFIATMNTADRSIRSIDVALRRRFDVFELAPDPSLLERFHYMHGGAKVPDLIDGFLSLNQALRSSLDRHHTIGHAFFMKPNLSTMDLQNIWDRKIFPLIEEFFFDQPAVVAEFSCERFWPSVANA